MTSAIIEIILGAIIWKLLPSWISFNSKGAREVVQLVCNIIGVALLLIGVVSFILCLL